MQWAESARKTNPTVGLDELLQQLGLLGTDDEKRAAESMTRWAEPTPASMQSIKSGALAITRWWSKRVAIVGGTTGMVSVVLGYISTFVEAVGEPITIALIAGGSIVISSIAIALAMFVAGDIRARGEAAAGRHNACAVVVSAFLAKTAEMSD